MRPDLEVVQIRPGESFTTRSHGYPFHTVRWHFHPEYELHQIVATRGRYFVGDFIGEFDVGNLVLTGPNLPHNWISDLPEGETAPLRCRFIQFDEDFTTRAFAAFPELGPISQLLTRSRRGVLFGKDVSAQVAPLMEQITQATGMRRIVLFMSIMEALARENTSSLLASESYLPDPSGYMSAGMNKALAFIAKNLTQPFNETDLARLAGQSASMFSRSFHKHTGMSPLQYIRRLRINLACQILMTDERAQIAEICFDVGFNNLSNFNRHFLAEKGMPPSQFRRLRADNLAIVRAA
jgi:AraC-like DNA-binding protein